jgi:rubrerythrin
MHTLRLWRTHAEQRGYTRIAELADYLQADELTHVRLATRWIRQLTAHDPGYREELARWARKAVARIEGFYGRPVESEPHFTFLTPGHGEPSGSASAIIGE